jgi:hypothetical protein
VECINPGAAYYKKKVMKVFANQNDNDAAEEERATNEIKSSTM